MTSLPIIDRATIASGTIARDRPPLPRAGPSLIELLLDEQQDLSAVDKAVVTCCMIGSERVPPTSMPTSRQVSLSSKPFSAWQLVTQALQPLQRSRSTWKPYCCPGPGGPVDYFQVRSQHPHRPLVVMLVLTQLSVGAFAVGMLLEWAIAVELTASMQLLHGLTALVFGLVALGASTLHLGRPRYAYRAILGLRHSWMSREILAFGLFAALACTFAAAMTFPIPVAVSRQGMTWLGMAVVASGAAGIFGSVMIYATLGREYWSFARTAVRFFLTSALLGTATAWLTASIFALAQPSIENSSMLRSAGMILCPALLVLASGKLIWEAALLRHLVSRSMTQLKRSAMLATGELSNFTLARFAAGLVGGVVIPAVLLLRMLSENSADDPVALAALTALLFVACTIGELLERYLFFAAVAAPRMPGGIR
jgi:formate dehydrogenase iron-sulfur subunit